MKSPRLRDDSGSTVVIAMIVMFLLSTLALAGLARSLSVMAVVGHGQRYDSALALADAGLNDAMYKLRENIAPTSTTWTWPTGTGTWQTVSPGKVFRYSVTAIGADEYQIDSVGKHGDIAHGIRAVVERGPGYTLFADERLDIGGTGAGKFGLSLSAVLELGGPSPDPIHIGSNTHIQLAGGASAGDFQHVYKNGRCVVDTAGTCPGEVKHPSNVFPLPAVTQPAGATSADVDACENMMALDGLAMRRGYFTGLVNGRGGLPYICNRDVKLGTMTVTNGPLVIYVMDGQLDMRGALVNAGGKAADLRVFKKGTANVLLNGVTLPLGLSAGDVTFTGYLYAPDTNLEVSANQWWKGAIYANQISATNNPVITLTYDRGLDRLVKQWDVSHYSEIPSGEANI